MDTGIVQGVQYQAWGRLRIRNIRGKAGSEGGVGGHGNLYWVYKACRSYCSLASVLRRKYPLWDSSCALLPPPYMAVPANAASVVTLHS